MLTANCHRRGVLLYFTFRNAGSRYKHHWTITRRGEDKNKLNIVCVSRRIRFITGPVTRNSDTLGLHSCFQRYYNNRLANTNYTYLHPEVVPCAWKHSGTQPVASCLWATELSSPLYFVSKDWYYHTFWLLIIQLETR